MEDGNTCGLTIAEEAHYLHVHESHLVQIQHNPRSAALYLCLQLLDILRLNLANQPHSRFLPSGIFFNLECHLGFPRPLVCRESQRPVHRNDEPCSKDLGDLDGQTADAAGRAMSGPILPRSIMPICIVCSSFGTDFKTPTLAVHPYPALLDTLAQRHHALRFAEVAPHDSIDLDHGKSLRPQGEYFVGKV